MGALLRICGGGGEGGGGCAARSPNPDPISGQNMPFSIPVFRPGLQNPYAFLDLTCVYKGLNYVTIT